jgi:hypothetical protein
LACIGCLTVPKKAIKPTEHQTHPELNLSTLSWHILAGWSYKNHILPSAVYILKNIAVIFFSETDPGKKGFFFGSAKLVLIKKSSFLPSETHSDK